MREGVYFTKWWQKRREAMLATVQELWTPKDGDYWTLAMVEDEKATVIVYPNDFVRTFETTLGYIILTGRYYRQNLASAETLASIGDAEEAARVRDAFPGAAALDAFTTAFLPALVIAGKTQAPKTAKMWGATNFPRYLQELVFATAAQRMGATFDAAFAEFLPAAPGRMDHLMRDDGTINPDMVAGDTVTRGEGRLRRLDSLDIESYFDSTRPPENLGRPPGSADKVKREPPPAMEECEDAFAMWTDKETDRLFANVPPQLRPAVKRVRIYGELYPGDQSRTVLEMSKHVAKMIKRAKRFLFPPAKETK